MSNLQATNTVFYNDMRDIIVNARDNAVRGVEYTRLMMYWHLGERIFVEDQQLNWSQYRQLLAIDDDYKREYYELEATDNAWTGREMERQINSLLYERLLMSNDKEAVLYYDRFEKFPDENPTVEVLLEEIKDVLDLVEGGGADE
ncbi:MAG: DUF1016 N-terminal domain-containing protein [Oscillospiraceae bacterium]|nr:DUF1016 N-terminal domain-containing protein [Oscillospiraceae bacterium]